MTSKSRVQLKPSLEKINWKNLGKPHVIGVDEVGRGCLAGPVCAGAALLSHDFHDQELTDSKLLSEAQRERQYSEISKQCVSLGWASVEEITEFNILHASFLAMRRAIQGVLDQIPGHNKDQILVVVDGHMKIPGLELSQIAIVKGDLRCAPISAAAIFAKVSRDQWMKEQALIYPGYDFEKHKGYGTLSHRKAIERLGVTKIHRPTFGGVKEWVSQRASM